MALKPRLIQNNKAAFVRKIAVHSPSGVGKTELAGTAQDVKELSDVYHLDLDAGGKTLQSRGDIQGEDARRSAEVQRVLMSFMNRDEDTKPYKTLIIDGFSALAKREFEEMTTALGKEPTFKEWGKLSALTMRLIHLIRDLPVTTIINTWTKEFRANIPGTDTPDPNAPLQYRPDVPKGAYDLFMGSCDDVFHLVKSPTDETRYLYTSEVTPPGKVFVAKMRDKAVLKQFTTEVDGKMLPIVKNPTWPDLFARYQAAFAPAAAPKQKS